MTHGPLTAAEYEQIQDELSPRARRARQIIVAVGGTAFLVAAVTGVIVVAVR